MRQVRPCRTLPSRAWRHPAVIVMLLGLKKYVNIDAALQTERFDGIRGQLDHELDARIDKGERGEFSDFDSLNDTVQNIPRADRIWSLQRQHDVGSTDRCGNPLPKLVITRSRDQFDSTDTDCPTSETVPT